MFWIKEFEDGGWRLRGKRRVCKLAGQPLLMKNEKWLGHC